MEFPKFLLGDNSDYPEDIFIIHTEFPRCIINLKDDEIEWLEEFDTSDEEELLDESQIMVEAASNFYDKEIALYNK